jgi:hypothetical protein
MYAMESKARVAPWERAWILNEAKPALSPAVFQTQVELEAEYWVTACQVPFVAKRKIWYSGPAQPVAVLVKVMLCPTEPTLDAGDALTAFEVQI